MRKDLQTSARRLVLSMLIGVLPLCAQALVTDLSGGVKLEGGKALTLMQELGVKSSLVLDKGAKLVLLQMQSGEELVFAGPGRLKITSAGMEGLKPQRQGKILALQGAGQLKPGAMARASVVMRASPGAEKPLMLSPKGPKLSELHPEFRWRNLGPKAVYFFALADAQGQCLFEVTLDECSVKVPKHLAFKPDGVYHWRLEAKHGGEVLSAQGEVQALSPSELVQVEKAAQDADSFSRKMAYAALLDQLEAKDEAVAVWKSLAKERPGDPVLKRLTEQ